MQIPNALPELDGGVAPLTSNVVIAAGRLAVGKGFDMLIDAFAAVSAKHPDWELHIYGKGEDRAMLEQQVSDLITHD